MYCRQYGADLPFDKILIPTLKHWYAYQLIYPWSLFFAKASILALYHRIFMQTKFRYLVYAATTFVTIYTLVAFFVNVRTINLPHGNSRQIDWALTIHLL
jgi:hypothetical protein